MNPLKKVLGAKAPDDSYDRPASGDSTAVTSKAASVHEKSSPTRLSTGDRGTGEMDDSSAQNAEQRETKTEEGGQGEKSSDEEETIEYPTGLPVLIVVAGLSLSVLLVALVWIPFYPVISSYCG